MSNLKELMHHGCLPPLSYYFARQLASRCGADEDSLLAYSAALLSRQNLDGHVCVNLAAHAGQPLIPCDNDRATLLAPQPAEWSDTLLKCREVGEAGQRQPLVIDDGRLYLYRHWRYETDVAAAISARCARHRPADPSRVRPLLDALFPDSADEADWQRIAVALALLRPFALISGGPGTGKTTTVVRLLAALLTLEPGLRIALAAPTGKAAARLSESITDGKFAITLPVAADIPSQAGTLHRLLGYGSRGYRYQHDNPLPVDCLVVDEASMVDLSLMASIIDALPPHARLVLLGDRDQLSSVEAGSVLGDISGRGCDILYDTQTAATLTELGCPLPAASISDERQAAIANGIAILRKTYRFQGDIGHLAAQVNAGDGDAALATISSHDGERLNWIETDSERLPGACIDWAVARYRDYLDAVDVADALAVFERARVLCALRHGPYGVDEISRRILQALLPDAAERDLAIYHGMPLLITRNDRELGLYNGDIGLAWKTADDKLKCYFRVADADSDQQRILKGFAPQQLPDFEPAYCLTVHKSQGSEYDEVLLILPPGDSPVMSRELVYTGITRTRQHLTLCSSPATLRDACARRTQRATGLAGRLGW
jgi:exodeoxyribonuclease V alpha subunit